MSAEKLKIRAGDKVLTASLEKNSSAEALAEMLREGPLTISMSDYAGMEKVGPIGRRLPTNDRPTHAKPCDLILYLGNSFVIYYEPNSWNFTKLGRIESVTQKELKAILGRGNTTVTLELG
ncbi:MAG TPA: hypothetical protein IAB97_05720 [Candidatus Choladousia intestinipullorum]|nr:hypothetical protein [Candidatus Choladousia intestinipullorum]